MVDILDPVLLTQYHLLIEQILEGDLALLVDACRHLLQAEHCLVMYREETGLVVKASTLQSQDQQGPLSVPDGLPVQSLLMDQEVPSLFRQICPTGVLVVLRINPFWWAVAQWSHLTQVEELRESILFVQRLLRLVFRDQAYHQLHVQQQQHFLTDLITSAPKSEILLFQQAAALEYNIFGQQTVVLAEWLHPEQEQSSLLQKDLIALFPEMLSMLQGTAVLCLFPTTTSQKLHDQLAEAQKALSQRLRESCLFAVGTACPYRDVHKGYQQAQEVLNFSKKFQPAAATIHHYEEIIPVYRFLTAYQEQSDPYFERIVELARRGGDALVLTLSYHLQQIEVKEKCARLSIQRATYYERLKRIGEIIGMDLNDLGNETFPLYQALQAYLAQRQMEKGYPQHS